MLKPQIRDNLEITWIFVANEITSNFCPNKYDNGPKINPRENDKNMDLFNQFNEWLIVVQKPDHMKMIHMGGKIELLKSPR